jgi:hypothetical protein
VITRERSPFAPSELFYTSPEDASFNIGTSVILLILNLISIIERKFLVFHSDRRTSIADSSLPRKQKVSDRILSHKVVWKIVLSWPAVPIQVRPGRAQSVIAHFRAPNVSRTVHRAVAIFSPYGGLGVLCVGLGGLFSHMRNHCENYHYFNIPLRGLSDGRVVTLTD